MGFLFEKGLPCTNFCITAVEFLISLFFSDQFSWGALFYEGAGSVHGSQKVVKRQFGAEAPIDIFREHAQCHSAGSCPVRRICLVSLQQPRRFLKKEHFLM